MTPKVRAALDAIEEVLLERDSDARNLWSVLTALRGPDDDQDDGNDRRKINATIPIRRAAFPRVAAQPLSYEVGAFGKPDVPYLYRDSYMARGAMYGRTHFEYHAELAALALGLIP